MQWLKERQDLLIAFNEMCQLKQEISESHTIDLKQNILHISETLRADTLHLVPTSASDQLEPLQSFCQLLIDYVSIGHFKIFEKLAEAKAQLPGKQSELDKNLLTKILRTTLLALDFNDQYENINLAQNYSELPTLLEDLSKLGEQLAERMDWEDQLIQNYLLDTANISETRASASSF